MDTGKGNLCCHSSDLRFTSSEQAQMELLMVGTAHKSVYNLLLLSWRNYGEQRELTTQELFK